MILLVLRPSFARLDPERWASGREALARRLENLVQVALIASATATLIGLVLFAVLNAQFQDDFGWDSIKAVADASYGQWYLFRFPLLLALAVLLLGKVKEWALAGTGEGGKGPSSMWWGAWLALGSALLFTSSMSGHAAVATPRIVALPADVLHLMSGSVWFAGIVLLAIALPDGWKTVEERRIHLLGPAVVRFSQVALIAIALVTITGTVGSFLHLAELNDLVDSSYGQALALKILVFCAILALGGINHFFLRKRMERGMASDDDDAVESSATAQRLFRKTIAAELAIAIAIFGLTGVLTNLGRTNQRTIFEEQAEPSGDPAAIQP